MLQAMRQNTKVILWVVVVAFVVTIFAVWGLDLQTGSSVTDPNVVGKVNGVPITRSQYQFAYQQYAQQIRASSPNQSLTYAQEQFVRGQAWDAIVYGIVTAEEIERLGISVTDQELVNYLRTTPPPEIRQYFTDEEGRFDNQAYQAALNNPEADWTSLEQLARERIEKIKLNEYLAAQVHVSEREVLREYQSQEIDMSMAYVEFPIATRDLADYEPTREDLRQYYESHMEDFKEAETRRLNIVRIPFEPSAADLDDAVFTMRRVRDQIVAGEEFGAMAQKYSEAPTSFVDGNTGFISRRQRGEPYFTALDSVEAGDISEVVVTDDGVYVLKFLERQQGEDGEIEYNVQEIFIAPMLSRLTTDSLFAVASAIHERASQSDLETGAAENQLELLSPTPFARGGNIEHLGFVRSVSEFAFSNEVGSLSDVLRDDENLYIAQLVETIPERYRPLEDVAESVNQYVMMERKRDAAERDARAFYRKAKATDWQTALDTYGLEAKETGTFRRTTGVDPFGPNSVIADVGLVISPGAASPPVEWRLTFFVVKLISRAEMDPEDYKTKIPEIKQALLQRKIQSFSQAWYNKLASEAQIEDYRLEG
jgi:parvulin-like peptidyl-prolyl isomerase